VDRNRTAKLDYAGNPIPSTRNDDIWEASLAPYVEARVHWNEKLRSVVGARLDYFHFDVNGVEHGDSGKHDDVIASPKGSLVLGPWWNSELYLSGGRPGRRDATGWSSRTSTARSTG
jgi:hypothetical protein